MAFPLQRNGFVRIHCPGLAARHAVLRHPQLSRSSQRPFGRKVGSLPIEKSSSSFTAVKDIDEIMKILPHRYPFLLVDRVVEIEAEKTIVGYKNVSVNDNFFTGHFPDRPIMPACHIQQGVLQVEALAQLGGILVLDGASDEARGNFFFGGVENCRFRKPVVPGDTLMMKVEITKYNKRFGICKAHGESFVGEDMVCDCDMTLVVAKER